MIKKTLLLSLAISCANTTHAVDSKSTDQEKIDRDIAKENFEQAVLRLDKEKIVDIFSDTAISFDSKQIIASEFFLSFLKKLPETKENEKLAQFVFSKSKDFINGNNFAVVVLHTPKYYKNLLKNMLDEKGIPLALNPMIEMGSGNSGRIDFIIQYKKNKIQNDQNDL